MLLQRNHESAQTFKTVNQQLDLTFSKKLTIFHPRKFFCCFFFIKSLKPVLWRKKEFVSSLKNDTVMTKQRSTFSSCFGSIYHEADFFSF